MPLAQLSSHLGAMLTAISEGNVSTATVSEFQTQLGVVDYAILLVYVIAVLAIGFALKRFMRSSSDFLTSGRSIPAWVTGLAFISANLGALELVGMAASGAKYGIATCHFYWVGAIPAMVFLAIFMMPFYYGSRARSVPEYLKMRFDERTRAFNSVSFAAMTVFASGISMNALAKLLDHLIGLDYNVGLWVCSLVVLIYVLKGGLTSAIYTEVLQFFMIVLGFSPVVYLGLKDVNGWGSMTSVLREVAQDPAKLGLAAPTAGHAFSPDAWTNAWKPLLGGATENPMGVDLFAMVFGLGFVLSFGYWCTNFLVVQRAMAARNMTAARRTPLIAAVPKMFFPALVIVPGMIAVALMAIPGKNYRIPPKTPDKPTVERALAAVKNAPTLSADEAFVSICQAVNKDETNQEKLRKTLNKPKVEQLIKDYAEKPLEQIEFKYRLMDTIVEYDYDGVILSLVKRYCPSGLLGLALTALLASFMSGMAGNVTAFNTVWTYDLYQAYIAPNKSDSHYLWMGKGVTIVGILLSIACAYFANKFNNAMDICQLVFGFVNAPLFATFLLGMFWSRTTSTGAFVGLVSGTATSALFHAVTNSGMNVAGAKGSYICELYRFPSEMAQNFWLASFAFGVCFLVTVVLSLATRRDKSDEQLNGLVYSQTPHAVDESDLAWYARPWLFGVVVLVAAVVLNYLFW
jgi:solute:Na+ symporter, SSS family